jgi:hypothetical protein
MITQAHGWVAQFRNESTTPQERSVFDELPVVCWVREEDGGAVGLVTAEKRGLRSAESYSNFSGYVLFEDERSTVIPAQLGWWHVHRISDEARQLTQRAWWTPIIAWLIGQGSWSDPVAIVTKADADRTMSETTLFVWAPERTSEGEGEWPGK